MFFGGRGLEGGDAEGVILHFKGKQVAFHGFFALVFGSVHFAVAELFSLTTLYSEMIFYTAPSETRL